MYSLTTPQHWIKHDKICSVNGCHGFYVTECVNDNESLLYPFENIYTCQHDL